MSVFNISFWYFKAFEDNIRKNRGLMTNWIKYAQWEESQKEIQRYLSETISRFLVYLFDVVLLPVVFSFQVCFYVISW